MGTISSAFAPAFKGPTSSSNPDLHIPQKKLYHIKPIFRSTVKWICRKPADLTRISKYRPKMITTVQLQSYCCLRESSVRQLCRILIENKSACNLVIFKPQYYLHNFDPLGRILRTTNHWRSLSLKIVEGSRPQPPLQKKQLKCLTRIGQNKDLADLQISVNCLNRTREVIFESLSFQIQRLRRIWYLYMSIGFACRDYGRDDEDTNSVLLKFKYPRSLEFLHLAFQDSNGIDTHLLPLFISRIRRCGLLKHLSFNFCWLPDLLARPEYEIWKNLGDRVSIVKTLKVSKYLLADDLEADRAYLNSFQHLKSLETLDAELVWHETEHGNPALSEIFFSHLASLTNLQDLHLKLRFYDSRLQSSPDLRSLIKLEKLCLKFEISEKVNRSQLIYNLALPYLKNLREFGLTFPFGNFSDEDIITLCSHLKQPPQLKNLCLNLKWNKINSKSIEVIADMIVHVKPVFLEVDLGVELKNTNSLPEKESLAPLFSALFALEFLESLSLDFSEFVMSRKELTKLSLALKKLKQLKSLSLKLPQFDCQNHFDGARKSQFLWSLKEHQNLSSLDLNFKGEGLCNREANILALCLHHFRHLENLKLHFEHAEKFGNDVLENLGSGIVSFSSSLRFLSFTVGEHKNFPISVVSKFVKGLVALDNLETLVLGLVALRPQREKWTKFFLNPNNLKSLRYVRLA